MRDKCTFLWFIENYRYCNDDSLNSPYFTVEELEKTSWRIGIDPRGDCELTNWYASLYIGRSRDDEGPEFIDIDYELSLFGADMSSLRSIQSRFHFKKGGGAAWRIYLEVEDVPPGILTIRCKMWRGTGEIHNIAPICARTRIGVEKISFLHVVKNFHLLEPNEKKTIEIPSHSKSNCVVSSSLYFTDKPSCEGEIILEIKVSNTNHFLCKRNVSLIEASGNMIACGKYDNRFDVNREKNKDLPLVLTRQAIMDKKSEYLPDDKLSLLCECAFSTGLEFERIEGTEYDIPTSSYKGNKRLKFEQD